jgi:hypothetical protein
MTGGPAEKPLRKAGKVALALAESIRLMELEAGDQLLIDAALALATNFSAAVARICSSLAGDDQPSASEGRHRNSWPAGGRESAPTRRR